MVQTESQYICIHQCLLTVLEGKENTSPIREIHDNQGYEGKSIDTFQYKLSLMKRHIQSVCCYGSSLASMWK